MILPGFILEAARNPKIKNKIPAADLPGSTSLETGMSNESISTATAPHSGSTLSAVHFIGSQLGWKKSL
jgi:hypothetical protein